MEKSSNPSSWRKSILRLKSLSKGKCLKLETIQTSTLPSKYHLHYLLVVMCINVNAAQIVSALHVWNPLIVGIKAMKHYLENMLYFQK